MCSKEHFKLFPILDNSKIVLCCVEEIIDSSYFNNHNTKICILNINNLKSNLKHALYCVKSILLYVACSVRT